MGQACCGTRDGAVISLENLDKLPKPPQPKPITIMRSPNQS